MQTADVDIANVMGRLDPSLVLMDHAADTAEEATAGTRSVADRLYRMWGR